jgi:cell wall-associated NlpC family hydrolase
VISTGELIDKARSWLGVPFRHQGRGHSGVDCAGFLVELMRASGELPIDYDEPANYSRHPQRQLFEIVQRYCTQSTTRVPLPGALVLIRWRPAVPPSHVGLCTGDTIIHCYQRAGGVVEHGYRDPWVRLTHSLWRMPGVRYE